MYLAINEVYEEFAVVTRHFLQEIENLQNEHSCSDVFYIDLDSDEYVDVDELIKKYESKRYRQVAITDYVDVIQFTIH